MKSLKKIFPYISKAACLLTIIWAGIVLVGWIFKIPSLTTGFLEGVSMRFNAAFCFLISGIILYLMDVPEISRSRKTIITVLLLVVFIIGMLTFSEFIFGWKTGLDELLYKDLYSGFHGRMSYMISINFVLFAVIFLLMLSNRKRLIFIQFFLLINLLSSLFIILNNAVGANFLYNILLFKFTSELAPVLVILLSVAVFFNTRFNNFTIPFLMKLYGYFLFISTFLLIIFFANDINNQKATESTKLMEHTQEVLLITQQLKTNINDLQNETRGYLITGEKTFMPDISRIDKTIDSNLNKLRILIVGNFHQKLRIDSIDKLTYKFIFTRKQLINSRQQEGFQDARKELLEGQGISIINKLDSIFTKFDQEENQLLAKGKSENEKFIKNSEKIIWLFQFTLILLVLFAGIVIYNNYRIRNEKEKLLKLSESKFRAILDNSFDPIGVHINGIWEMCNPAALKLFGYTTQEELLGTSILNVIAPAEHERIKELIKKRAETKDVPSKYTTLGLKKDGTVFDLDVSLSTFVQEKKLHVLVILRDITERNRYLNALQESEYKYRSLVEQASDAIFISNADGIYVDVNTSGCQLLGYSREEFLKLTILDLVFKEDLKINPVHFDDMRAGKIIHYERRLKRKDGTAVEVEITGKKIADGRNLIIVRDIIERKLAQIKIQNANQYNRSLIEASIDPLVTINADGKITDVNKATEMVTGVVRENIIGTDFSNYFTEPEKARNGYMKALSLGKVNDYPLTIKHVNGKLTDVLYNATIYKNAEGEVLGVFAAARDVTERKEMEEALKNSEKKFRHLITELNTGVLLHGPNGEVLMSNQKALDLIALSEDQVLGKAPFDPDWNVIHEDGSVYQDEEHAIPQAIKTQKTIKSIMGFYNPMKKERLWVLVTAAPEIEKDGTIRQLICTFTDITELKKTEEALFESELKYRELVENSPDAIAIYIDEIIVYGNKQLFQLMAASANEELIGKPAFQFVHPDSQRLVIKRMKELKKTTAVLPLVEEKFIRLNGSEVDVEVKAMPIRFENKPAVQLIIRDITDRKRAEEQIRKLSQAVEQSPLTIVITDTSGDIQYANPKFEETTGYSIEEAIGKNPRILQSGETLPEKYEELWKTITSGKAWYGEFHNRKKNGELYWEFASISPFFDAQGKIINFLAIKEDITQRKKKEIEVQQLNDELRELSNHLQNVREEERTAVAKEIHDELGQNLVALNMNAAYLKKTIKNLSIKDNEIIDDQIEVAQKLLAKSRSLFDSLHPSVLDELGLNAAIEWYSINKLKAYKIKVEIKSNIPEIKFSKEISYPLFRIFQEVVSNVKLHSKATEVLISLFKTDKMLTLSLKDNGVGFEKKSIDTIHSHGLLTIRERVFTLNGKLKIDSVIGEGTTVTIAVPLNEDLI